MGVFRNHWYWIILYNLFSKLEQTSWKLKSTKARSLFCMVHWSKKTLIFNAFEWTFFIVKDSEMRFYKELVVFYIVDDNVIRFHLTKFSKYNVFLKTFRLEGNARFRKRVKWFTIKNIRRYYVLFIKMKDSLRKNVFLEIFINLHFFQWDSTWFTVDLVI